METIIVALITLAGTIGSGVLSAVISNNLIKYRVEQLEKKVDKHNNLIDRMYKAETNIELIQEEIYQAYSQQLRLANLDDEPVIWQPTPVLDGLAYMATQNLLTD